MSPFMVKQTTEPIQYELFGISNHYGGMGGGHYTAYCKQSYSKNWYEFNDGSVSQIGDLSKLKSSAYLLFYQRSKKKASNKTIKL